MHDASPPSPLLFLRPGFFMVLTLHYTTFTLHDTHTTLAENMVKNDRAHRSPKYDMRRKHLAQHSRDTAMLITRDAHFTTLRERTKCEKSAIIPSCDAHDIRVVSRLNATDLSNMAAGIRKSAINFRR